MLHRVIPALLLACHLLLAPAASQAQQSDPLSGLGLDTASAEISTILSQIKAGNDGQVRHQLQPLVTADDVQAMLLMAHCWQYGIGGERSREQALTLFKRAAEKMGSAVAMRRTGLLLASDKSTQQAARSWLQQAVNAGDIGSLYELGLLHERGIGGDADVDRALFLYRQAAEAGLTDAMVHLGECAMAGLGLDGEPDEVLGLAWFEKAAEVGSPEAMLWLGRLHDGGKADLPVDHDKSFDWVKKAADAGYLPAQNELGRRYREGRGVPIDIGEALRWFSAAASQRYPAAMVNLGVIYQEGAPDVVEKNPVTAATLFIEAAKRNDRVGQFLLARLYAEGNGVAKDLVAAYVLADESSRRGYQPAASLRDDLKNQLTPEQLGVAEERLRAARASIAAPAK